MAKSLPRPGEKKDLPEGVWQPEPVEAWWRRWMRGWRLGLLVVGVLAAVGMWRGERDYRSLKTWRGRVSAEKAIRAAADGRMEEAQQLLDRAGVLAPADSFVLRTMADFAERRSDVMALYALRRLQVTGQAEEGDLLRQARLAIEWGQPGLVPVEAVQRWSVLAPETLDVGPLEVGALWLASRGMEAEAEMRMRRAMELAAGRGWLGEARRLNLSLARLLGSPASGPPVGDRLREAVTRLLDVGRDAGASDAEVSEALTRAAAVLAGARSRGSGALEEAWLEETSAVLMSVTAYRMETAGPATRLALRLAHAELEFLNRPLDRAAIARDLAMRAQSLSDSEALAMARWLHSRGFYDDVLRVVGGQEEGGRRSPEWLEVALEAWVAKKDWESAGQALKESESLAEWRRIFWEYRIGRAGVTEAGADASVRERLRSVLRRVEGADAVEAAAMLEALGDRQLAIEVYRHWQRHDHYGLAARVGLVRCLHAEKGEGAELIAALQELLTVAPHLDEARGDLAYIRLLPPQPPRPDDLEAVARLLAEAPRFLAYRVAAALAALREDRPAEAMAVFGETDVPWENVPAGWRAVRACALAANGRRDEAKSLASGIPKELLRPGEVRLLEQFSLDRDS